MPADNNAAPQGETIADKPPPSFAETKGRVVDAIRTAVCSEGHSTKWVHFLEKDIQEFQPLPDSIKTVLRNHNWVDGSFSDTPSREGLLNEIEEAVESEEAPEEESMDDVREEWSIIWGLTLYPPKGTRPSGKEGGCCKVCNKLWFNFGPN